VLIVDDNARNAKLARDVLVRAGFRTIEAATGAEAIALALEHTPDVVLMDLRLPDLDGAEAARALKHDARTAAIPVVALSAARERVGSDFAGFLEKPIDVVAFPDDVRAYVR